jgi:mono/diheme cytochrome c family protein
MRAVALFVLGVLASAGAGAQSIDGNDELGLAFVEANCSRCHAVGPAGDSPVAAAPPFRDLGRFYPVEALAEALAEGIVTGHPEMPEFVLEPDQIADVIAYLRSIQVPAAD